MNKDEFRFLKIIQKLDMFKQLNLEEARRLLNICKAITFDARQRIYHIGDESHDMLILVQGKLIQKDRAEQVLGEILPGFSVGEMGFLTGHCRLVHTDAVIKSTGLAMSKTDFDELMKKDREMYIKILENAVDLLAHRLTGTSHS